MASDTSEPTISAQEAEIEMPRATIAPLILSLGIAMLAVGTITSPVFLLVGGVIGIAGLSLWIVQLQPGHGYFRERFVPVSQRPSMISRRPSAVEYLQSGMPGYRLRLPMEIHPISAGFRGGIVGGLVMPVPA
jgi:hypothetical protein